jgi:ATP-dependent Clp protease ATP-binding subunit ClpB
MYLMRMDRLTLRAQDVINNSQNIATENNSPEIHPEHILKALIDQDGGIFYGYC